MRTDVDQCVDATRPMCAKLASLVASAPLTERGRAEFAIAVAAFFFACATDALRIADQGTPEDLATILVAAATAQHIGAIIH